MPSDADTHEVDLIPVTLVVSENIMGLGVFLLLTSLASTGGITIYGWLVTIISALGFSMIYAKMPFLGPSPGGSYAYARHCFGPFLGYQANVLYWLACWIGNIAMVVIGVRYLGYFFPILKDPLVLTVTCIVVLWIFVLLNIVSPKVITRVQAVATVLALIPIVGIAVFGRFWFRDGTYMTAWNISGLDTFGAIQSILNATLWPFIGVESASAAAGVVKNPKHSIPIATIDEVLVAVACYTLSTAATMGMIPNAALRVSAPPFGDAARMTLGDTAEAIVSLYAAAGCLGSLNGRTLLMGQTAKVAADDGLSPPIFTRINRAGTPVTGLITVGILVTIFQLNSISPDTTKEFGLVPSVSVIFTLVSYPYTCAALLLPGHDHFSKARPAYPAVTTIAFLYCIWAVARSGAREVIRSLITLMVTTAICALDYSRLYENPYPLDAPIGKDQLPLIRQT